MKLRWLVLACATVSSWAESASACSVILPEKQSLTCAPASGDASQGAHTSVASAHLQLDSVEIRRSQYAPPGRGDCGELGSTQLRFSLAGSSNWPDDVAVLVTLRQGNFSYFEPPPTTLESASGWLLLPKAGAVRFFGPDDPREPLALQLEARAVDCSGAASAPIEVRISDPGRTPDAGGSAPQPSAVASSAAEAAPLEVQQPSTPRRVSCAVGALSGGARGGGARGGLRLALVLAALAVLVVRAAPRCRLSAG